MIGQFHMKRKIYITVFENIKISISISMTNSLKIQKYYRHLRYIGFYLNKLLLSIIFLYYI